MTALQNEPVVTAASIASLVSAIIILARSLGWLSLTDEQFQNLMTVVVLALPVLGALWARRKVTPIANPKDNEGVALVREAAG